MSGCLHTMSPLFFCLSSQRAWLSLEQRLSSTMSVPPFPRWPYGEKPRGAWWVEQAWGHTMMLEKRPVSFLQCFWSMAVDYVKIATCASVF